MLYAEKLCDDEVEREVAGRHAVTDLVAAHAHANEAGEVGELNEVFGVALHLEAQRRPQLRRGAICATALRRNGVQTFGIVCLGRIGTALRAKAFQFRVVAYDLYMPNGTELGVDGYRATYR